MAQVSVGLRLQNFFEDFASTFERIQVMPRQCSHCRAGSAFCRLISVLCQVSRCACFLVFFSYIMMSLHCCQFHNVCVMSERSNAAGSVLVEGPHSISGVHGGIGGPGNGLRRPGLPHHHLHFRLRYGAPCGAPALASAPAPACPCA